MKQSDSFRPIGSRPSSSEPTRQMAWVTSGTACMIAPSMRLSSSADRSRLIEGSLAICMMKEPSSIVGMKLLPVTV